MAELDLRRSPWNEGLGVSTEFLHHQLYVMSCVVLASPRIDDLGNHTVVGLRERFQEAEVGHLLLTVAAAIRNAMDQNPSRAEYWLQGVDITVGELIEDESNPKKTRLSFREACNKIIYCLAINFDYCADPLRRGEALNPVVYLYGDKGSKTWKATLDLLKFVDVGFQVA